MDRTRQFLRGSALSGLSVAAATVAMLVVWKLVTNRLPQHEAAAFFLLILSADLLNLATGLGLQTALPKLVAAEVVSRRPALARACVAGQFALASLVALLLGFLWFLLPVAALPTIDAGAKLLYAHAWLVLPLFLTGVLRDNLSGALAGLERYGARAWAGLVAALANVALTALLLAYAPSLLMAALASLAAQATGVLVLATALPRPAPATWDWHDFTRAARFSFPLYLNGLLSFAYQRADTAVLAALLGSTAVPIYETAKRFPLLLSRGLVALLVPLLPNLAALVAQGDLPAAERLLRRAVVLMAVVGYAAVLLCHALAAPLVLLIASDEYLAATQVIGILMVSTTVMLQAGILGQALIALGRPAHITAINTLLALIGVGLTVLLAPTWGLVGAAIASVAAIAVSFLLQAISVHRAGLRCGLGWLLAPQLLFGGVCASWYLLAPGPGLLLLHLLAYGVLGGGLLLRLFWRDM